MGTRVDKASVWQLSHQIKITDFTSVFTARPQDAAASCCTQFVIWHTHTHATLTHSYSNNTLIPPWWFIFLQSSNPPFCEISEEVQKYPKMSAMQNELSKTKPKTFSMFKWKKKNPMAGICLRTFTLIFFIYILAQLLSFLRICVVILSVFLGDLMSFVKTHPSGSGAVGP